MNRREFLLASVAAGVIACDGTFTAARTKESIREFLKVEVGDGAKAVGRVAVVVEDGGTSLAAFGSADAPGVVMDGHTVFEIGSITKVLTALMLADMVARGEVGFDDPVARYLPSSVTLPERGRAITLLDLASYRSGLPNMPDNLPAGWDLSNPFADYAAKDLYAFVSNHVPEHEPGSHYEYANVGFALLGIALARRAGRSYEELLIERICRPLGLTDTRVTCTGSMRVHLAQGHNAENLKPAPRWDMPGLPEMGAVLSNAMDLAVLLRASMGIERTPLNASLTRLLGTRGSTGEEGTDAALGWFISSNKTEEIVWKTGQTGGFSSFIGFSTRSQRGAILLSNGGYTGDGFRLINPEFDPGDLGAILR